MRHAGAIRHDVADHAADAATVRDAVDKVASGVTRPHMYWWSCLQACRSLISILYIDAFMKEAC